MYRPYDSKYCLQWESVLSSRFKSETCAGRNTECIFRMCWRRFELLRNTRPHSRQSNLLCFSFICAYKSFGFSNASKQCWQTWDFLACTIRWYAVANAFGQCLHLNIDFPSSLADVWHIFSKFFSSAALFSTFPSTFMADTFTVLKRCRGDISSMRSSSITSGSLSSLSELELLVMVKCGSAMFCRFGIPVKVDSFGHAFVAVRGLFRSGSVYLAKASSSLNGCLWSSFPAYSITFMISYSLSFSATSSSSITSDCFKASYFSSDCRTCSQKV